MSGGWGLGSTPAEYSAGSITLVEGSTFCVSDSSGTIRSGAAQGVFYMDTRFVSSWRMTVDDEDLEDLTVFDRQPHHATFLGRAKPPTPAVDSMLLVQRERYVGAGMREDIIVRNFGPEPAAVTIDIELDADFADLFAVKEGRARPMSDRTVRVAGSVLEVESETVYARRGLRVRADGAVAYRGRMSFRPIIPARDEWRTTIEALPTLNGTETEPKFPLNQPIENADPTVQLQAWSKQASKISGVDERIRKTLLRSEEDLGSLRIIDPLQPGRPAIAAGAPWFMALFGRDSLLTAYMSLVLDQDLALGTLHTLARYQGTKSDPQTEEQPGRILHEMRFGAEATLALGGGNVYYGTVDATPLFVVLLGEIWRWGLPDGDLQKLLPHADRALDWISKDGDADGDGFTEYKRQTTRGLRNQGWKDSWDGINFADGRLAEPPIALCEVQGYVYAALLARASIARHLGDTARAEQLTHRAAELKSAFNERFWLPDEGWFAVGLDRYKAPIDALTSNIGHCLWTGIVDDDKAPRVAELLLSEQMFSGWGVRTLASTMGAYNPLSYHNGSVWPHDNAIVAAGLMRYGFVREAQTIAQSILDAAECFNGRLPELFTGVERSTFPRPVPYPASCVPQAWAAATPLMLLRSLLRFDPMLPDGEVYIDPALPRSIPKLQIDNLRLSDTRLTIAADHHQFGSIDGLPPHLQLRAAGRRPEN
ncbi:MAG TPA: glycogen debranching N-terminal domain-containing protein [Actinomycetota bacterium]|nr:glycogen debranching N-terminal domain-containing protein [Actinomycetota bacterium]